MNRPFRSPSPEACERLPAFILAGLSPRLQDAIAALRRARNEAADQIERLLTSPISHDETESVVNPTLDPDGRTVSFLGIYTEQQIAAARAVFAARHLVADEIERLMAVLDELSGDEDLELNVPNGYDDPWLDDGEGVTVSSRAGSYVSDGDSEPSLAGFGALAFGGADLEEDPSESGIADLDGLIEQFRRP
ncbi:hypothetical protein ACVWZM_001552 [Bradyrhizobium sp. USDA 4501]